MLYKFLKYIMTGSISYFRKHEIYIKKQFIYKSSQNHNMLIFFIKKKENCRIIYPNRHKKNLV